jgi:16S rRNA (guanine1207-N2)-methyltransferase
MHAVSQIIERNLHRRGACSTGLWINPERDDAWRKATASCASLKLFCQDYGAYTFLRRTGADIEFSAFPQTGKEKYQWVIINLPRQKALLRMMLDCAADVLTDDGVLWLAGENKAGIKSADKLLKMYFRQVRKLDNARHCTLYEAGSALGETPFSPLAYQEEWPLNCGQTEVKITSYPGVFAHGRLDAGTALLLEALSALNPEGDVLDFACGAGLVGACIAANQPQANVTLLDSSALALKACEETLAANQLSGSVLASDGLSELKDSFDFIISNPPIHAGVKTDSRLSQRLLDSVHDHIRPRGMLVMVANVHLPYEKWLSQRFRRCSELIANANYKVIAAIK